MHLSQPPFLASPCKMMTSTYVVQGIKHILKSHSSLKKLTSQNPVEWPITKVVLSKLKDENRGKVHQGSGLHHFRDTTTKACQDQALANLKSLDDKMQTRLEWSDVDMMRLILLFLNTQSWQGSERSSSNDDDDDDDDDNRLSEIKAAFVSTTDVFRAPLEAKRVNLFQFRMRLKTLLTMLELTLGLDVIVTRKSGTSYIHRLMP